MGAAVMITRMDHTSAELRCYAGKCKDTAQVRRLLALALVLEGVPRTEAALCNGMDRQTLMDWVHRTNTDGIDGLKSRISPDPNPLLTTQQMAALKALVLKGPDPVEHHLVRWPVLDIKRSGFTS